MHREVMKVTKGQFIDHKNGNGLDNQKSNLRLCSNQENSRNQRLKVSNTSGYKGVSWSKQLNNWAVQIRINGKKVHGGYFLDKEEAAKKYNELAKQYHGEFANLNIIS